MDLEEVREVSRKQELEIKEKDQKIEHLEDKIKGEESKLSEA